MLGCFLTSATNAYGKPSSLPLNADATAPGIIKQTDCSQVLLANADDATTAPVTVSKSEADSASKDSDQAKRAHLAKTSDKAKKKIKPISPDDRQPYTEGAVKHYNRGVELHQSGFLNQAIAEYKLAILADERIEEAYSNLGVIYAAQRNYPKAKSSFEMALLLKPNRPTTLNGLGTVLYAQGHIKDAKKKWQQALAADPNFASAYYNMGNAYESEKNLPEALDAYAKAISISPNMADAYFRMGTIYNRQHHYAQASTLLRKALALAPDSDFAREAKRIEGSLESDFAKSEKESRKQRMSNAAHSNGSADGNATAVPNPKPTPAKKGKATKDDVSMFVQPQIEPAQAKSSNETSTP